MTFLNLPAGVVNGKFDQKGNALPFFGNTIIGHIKNTLLFPKLCDYYSDAFKSVLHNRLYHLLPPESYHITLFDGACKKNSTEWYWPSFIPTNESIEMCTEYMTEKIISHNITSPSINFMVSEIKPLVNTMAIVVKPTDYTSYELKKFRDELSSVLGIQRGDHDDYVYHITLGYLLKAPDAEEFNHVSTLLTSLIDNLTNNEKFITLDKAEFCKYKNIISFDPVLYF